MTCRLLVADDSSTIQKVIKIAFSRFETEIYEAQTFAEALASVQRTQAEVIIMDASLPGAKEPADFVKLRDAAEGAPLLLLVGSYDVVDEEEFRHLGFKQFLKKPFESSDIVTMVDELLNGRLRQHQRAKAPSAQPMPNSQEPTQSQVPSAASAVVPPPPPSMRGERTSKPETLLKDAPESGYSYSQPSERGTAAYYRDEREPVSGFHSGFDERLDESDVYQAAMPPPPQVDIGRKGRRAFSKDDRYSDSRDSSDHDQDFRSPPAPPFSAEPLPQVPANVGLRGSQPPPFSSPTDFSAGMDPDRGSDHWSPPVVNTSKMPARPLGKSSHASPESRATAALNLDEVIAALVPLVEERLPALVREAVELYCDRHFKSLAREVIALELRRLADEKARHLVDN